MPEITLCRGDLTEYASIARCLEQVNPALIFHLAGATDVRRLDEDLRQLQRSVDVNLTGTLNLVQAAHRRGAAVERFIRTGGLEEYGHGAVPYNEAQRERPVSPYSASQVAATQYCQMLQPHLAFALVTLRPALVYGPAQSTAFFIPSLITHSLHKEDLEMTSGEQRRDLIYIDDVVEAFVRTATAPALAGEVINISSGHAYTVRHVAETILSMMEPGTRLHIGAARARPSEIHHLLGSNEKAGTLLAWSPQTSLKAGLAQTIAWFRKHAQRSENAST